MEIQPLQPMPPQKEGARFEDAGQSKDGYRVDLHAGDEERLLKPWIVRYIREAEEMAVTSAPKQPELSLVQKLSREVGENAAGSTQMRTEYLEEMKRMQEAEQQAAQRAA